MDLLSLVIRGNLPQNDGFIQTPASRPEHGCAGFVIEDNVFQDSPDGLQVGGKDNTVVRSNHFLGDGAQGDQ